MGGLLPTHFTYKRRVWCFCSDWNELRVIGRYCRDRRRERVNTWGQWLVTNTTHFTHRWDAKQHCLSVCLCVTKKNLHKKKPKCPPGGRTEFVHRKKINLINELIIWWPVNQSLSLCVCLQLIAIAMDVFTDVDIFKEVVSATLRGVVVYILLDDTQFQSFLTMSHRVGVNIQDLKVRVQRLLLLDSTTYGKTFSRPCEVLREHRGVPRTRKPDYIKTTKARVVVNNN